MTIAWAANKASATGKTWSLLMVMPLKASAPLIRSNFDWSNRLADKLAFETWAPRRAGANGVRLVGADAPEGPPLGPERRSTGARRRSLGVRPGRIRLTGRDRSDASSSTAEASLRARSRLSQLMPKAARRSRGST